MGFFDKLRKAIDSATESFTNNNSSNSIKYLEDIVINLLVSVDKLRKKDIQKFIKVKHNVDCDDAVLDKILSKIKADSVLNGETWYSLPFSFPFKQRLEILNHYAYEESEIQDICYADFREEMRLKFNNMLEVIKADISGDSLVYAFSSLVPSISEITKDFKYKYSSYNQPLLAAQVISDEILKLFFAKDQFIKDFVIMCALQGLHARYKMHARHKPSGYIPYLYNFAIRAMHFESHRDDAEYTSITKAECYDAVAASKYYQNELAEKPQNKERFYNIEASIILTQNMLGGGNKRDWLYWAAKNIRFVDAACFEAFQFVSEEYDPCTSAEEAALITNDLLTKNVKVQED